MPTAEALRCNAPTRSHRSRIAAAAVRCGERYPNAPALERVPIRTTFSCASARLPRRRGSGRCITIASARSVLVYNASMRSAVLISFVFFWVAPAFAQTLTTAQLEQLATQDAIAAGIDPATFLAQINAESNFNPNVGCNSSGACGIAQFIPSTAAQFGLNPSDPVASLQAAAQYDAQLVQQTGSLTAALTAYSGGCTPSSPCNPLYAQAFQDAAAADAGNPSSPTTFGDGSTLAAGDITTAAPPTATPSTTAMPFQWTYDQVIKTITAQVDSSIQTVEGLIANPLTILLALAVAVRGFRVLVGDADAAELLGFMIRAALVVAFVQVGNSFYSGWVEGFVVSLPGFFAAAFAPSANIATPAQIFDAIYNAWNANAIAIWHETSWSAHGLFIGICIALATLFIVIPSLVVMFTVFLIGTFLTLVMLTIGPIIILGYLFRATHRFTHGYVNVLATLLIFSLVVDIVLGMLSAIMVQVMANFTPSGSPDTDLPGLFGIGVTLFIMGLSMARLPRLVDSIGGGVSVSMEKAGSYMMGGAAADAAKAAAPLMRAV